MTTNYTGYSKLSAVLLLPTYTTHRLIKITTHLVQINLTNRNVKFFKSALTNTDQQLQAGKLKATQTTTSLPAVWCAVTSSRAQSYPHLHTALSRG